MAKFCAPIIATAEGKTPGVHFQPHNNPILWLTNAQNSPLNSSRALALEGIKNSESCEQQYKQRPWYEDSQKLLIGPLSLQRIPQGCTESHPDTAWTHLLLLKQQTTKDFAGFTVYQYALHYL